LDGRVLCEQHVDLGFAFRRRLLVSVFELDTRLVDRLLRLFDLLDRLVGLGFVEGGLSVARACLLLRH